MDCWRLIEDSPRAGSFNMAADNSLFERHCPGDPPVLRLYTWNPPALSLGRNEKIDDKINLEFCRNQGIHVIRRMTGGKAVLHGSDITYSVVGDLNDPQFGGGVLETYRSKTSHHIKPSVKKKLKRQKAQRARLRLQRQLERRKYR